MPDPLIVTLTLDPASQSRLDADRTRWFPPERNHLAAHVTLFHHLPGGERAAVARDLAEAAARPPFAVEVTRVRSLGRGVAYDLASPDLYAVRSELAERWAPWLTRQDQQRFAPHVTVQNKVDPSEARRLLGELRAAFAPWTADATGLGLWHYRGGPWEAAGHCAFATGGPGSA